VPETTECSVDSQRPRVDATQFCASAGDQLAIIGKVSRGMTGQGPIDERRYLEHNAVKITKHWRDTVGSLSASYQGGSVSLCVVILMMLYQPTC